MMFSATSAGDAAALEIEQGVLVQLTDGRAMVADDVLLGAEDQRHGLVDDTVAQHQDGLLLAALGACGAVLEVDSSAEYLLRVVLERAGSV